eukprot:3223665-Pyramimonas_sp.AAC.1
MHPAPQRNTDSAEGGRPDPLASRGCCGAHCSSITKTRPSDRSWGDHRTTRIALTHLGGCTDSPGWLHRLTWVVAPTHLGSATPSPRAICGNSPMCGVLNIAMRPLTKLTK